MTLRECLLERTEADRYVKIYDGGWLTGMCYIDYEDLFIVSLDHDFLRREVKGIELVYDEDFVKMIYRVDV